jgi:hypothetical protein
MPISEFTISVGRTINMGNYENLKIDASVTVQMAEGDDYAVTKQEAREELRSLLESAYRAGIRRTRKPEAEE